jgi:hypothetical protein
MLLTRLSSTLMSLDLRSFSLTLLTLCFVVNSVLVTALTSGPDNSNAFIPSSVLTHPSVGLCRMWHLSQIVCVSTPQDDFVHRLIQNGTLKFLQQTYKSETLWTPRDCRILRTSPSEESYKEFTKCLTLILTVVKLYPLKTLQREILTYVVKQLSFFIFPPNRCHNRKQNHLIKRAKKFQEGK